MGGARQVIDAWPQVSGLEEVDVDLVQKHFVQSVVRTAPFYRRAPSQPPGGVFTVNIMVLLL